MSTTLFPSYQLVEKNACWNWKEPHEAVFTAAKRRLKDAQVLVPFDPNKELKFECDASPHGVGAALFHTVGNV